MKIIKETIIKYTFVGEKTGFENVGEELLLANLAMHENLNGYEFITSGIPRVFIAKGEKTINKTEETLTKYYDENGKLIRYNYKKN